MSSKVDLKLENLDVSLSGKEIIRHISLKVQGGAFVGLIGPNGCGKTTLLNMASGIPDNLNDVMRSRLFRERKTTTLSPREFYEYEMRQYAKPITLDNTLEAVNGLPLMFEPGSKVSYSNTNYIFLGEVLRRVSGLSLESFMQENIFKPLGMTRTRTGAVHADAVSYGVFKGEYFLLGRSVDDQGDGCIVTSAGDLCKWLNALMEGKLLEANGRRMMFEMYKGDYGFGWQKGANWYEHGGGLLGYHANVFLSFERRVAVAKLSNRDIEWRSVYENHWFAINLANTIANAYTQPRAPYLVPLTEKNIMDCFSLKVSKQQELLVEPNSVSIAEAYINPKAHPLLLSDRNQAIGFVLLLIDKEEKRFELSRFMVDDQLQNKGYGKELIRLSVDYLRKVGAKRIAIPYDRDCIVANHICEQFGFKLEMRGNYPPEFVLFLD